MSIIRFQPNTPVRLWLTRTDGAAAPSQFPDAGTQFQWKAKNAKDEPLTFYANNALNQKLLELINRTQNILAHEIEIVKRTFANKSEWVVQIITSSTPAGEAAAPEMSANTAPANGESENEKTPGVQRMVRLWMQCYLEMVNANHSLNGHGLKGEELRQAATTVFISCTSKGFIANPDRIRLLLDELKQREPGKPVITHKQIQEEFKELMQTVTSEKELTYEPTDEHEPPAELPLQESTAPAKNVATNGFPKLSPTKVQSLIAAAASKNISPETLIAGLRAKLSIPNLTKLEDLPDKFFSQACTTLNRIKIE